MTLQINQTVKSETLGMSLKVKRKLGEGGQGVVYLVRGSGVDYAVKWYNPEQSTEEQKQAILHLVRTGAPQGSAGRRFVWPLDVVTLAGSRQFGYLMPLMDVVRFSTLGEIQARLKTNPTPSAMCEISYQTANSYRALHLAGYCYRDISTGNVAFDPRTGEVLICDNDNVGVNGQSTCQVWGTMEFMPPELVKAESVPSTSTDLHALAVFLFYFWLWHHPMHGQLEYDLRCWDLPAKRRIYGECPIFVFDPSDARNRLPNDSDYDTAKNRWRKCPQSLKELFIRAFTVGLKDPASRVTEGEWQRLFLQLKDGITRCPNDGAENIWEPGLSSLECWKCRKPIPLPPKLLVTYAGGRHHVLLNQGVKLLRRHADPHVTEKDSSQVIGEVVRHPTRPELWGIRNLTSSSWSSTFPDGSTKEIPSQKSAPLLAGLKVVFGETSGEIIP